MVSLDNQLALEIFASTFLDLELQLGSLTQHNNCQDHTHTGASRVMGACTIVKF